MTPRASFVTGALAAGIIAICGPLACSEESTAPSSARDAGRREASSNTPADASSPVDATTGEDAPEPANASDPGAITCGAASCEVEGSGDAASVCCSRVNGESICQTLGDACSGGTRFACDEDADCPGEQSCCLAFAQAGGPRAICQAQCDDDQLHVCKTSDGCGPGETCADVTCVSRTYRSCNKPSFCSP